MARIPAAATWLLGRTNFVLRRLALCVDGFGWRRGLVYAWRDVQTRTRQGVVAVDGHQFNVRFGRSQSDLRTLIHVWCRNGYALDGIDNPAWVVDAGANVGYSAAWFATRFPATTVVAIEPDPANADLLARNVEHLPNVHLVRAALMAEPGTADLVDTGAGPWAMRVGAAGEAAGTVVGQVRCVTMQQIIEDFGIDRIGYLKVDIEGGELEVFASSASWIDQVDAIAVELHDRFRPGASRAFMAATAGFSREFVRGEDSFAVRA